MENVGSPLAQTFRGVVLAAGQSTRMGRDKALLEIEGQPLWLRQRALLAAAGVPSPMISVRSEQTWLPADIEAVHDRAPDLGPMGGIAAALARGELDAPLIVLAVDLPRIPFAWLERLKKACSRETGAIGCDRDGKFEPLAAIYPPTLRERIDQAFSEKKLSLQYLARAAVAAGEITILEIGERERPWFENWNTPASVTG